MSERLSELVRFMAEEMRIDQRIIASMTEEMGFESLDDFAHFWTTAEYENGVREDIVANVPPFMDDLSRPAARVQVARLRHAWEIKRLGRPADPPTVGYGVVSDPLSDCSYTSLFLAVETALLEPWRIVDVDPGSCTVEWNSNGYLDQRLRLNDTDGELRAKVHVREESGEVLLRSVEEVDEPEVVLQLHIWPLRLEVFARRADGVRVPWPVPYDEALEALEEIARLARAMEDQTSRELGLGLEVEARQDLQLDTLWQAIQLLAPERLGEGLEGEMRMAEAAREAIFRFAADGRAEEEQVLTLHTEPLRCEIFNRHVAEPDTRFHSPMPRAEATSIIYEVMSLAQHIQSSFQD